MSLLVLALTFRHHFSQVELVAPSQVPTRDVASSCCGQKEPPLLGSRVLRGSQPVISSSQASVASVCVVRSRNVLCGKRPTKSRKLMASVSTILHNLFDPKPDALSEEVHKESTISRCDCGHDCTGCR